MRKVDFWSFTMDYETEEIVMTATIDGERFQLRAIEKDIDSMKRWFEIDRYMFKEAVYGNS